MSVPLVVVVLLVACKLGPWILRLAGRLLALTIICLCIAPHAPRPATEALVMAAAIAAAAYQTGRIWDAWRRREGATSTFSGWATRQREHDATGGVTGR